MRAGKICIFLYHLTSISLFAQEYRLSKDLIPDLYDIHIKPYLRLESGNKQFTFDGEVNITLHSVVNNLKEITLHKDLIDISESVLYDANGLVVQKINSEFLVYDSETDKLTINLSASLVVGKNYILYFKYCGEIRNGLAGFYRATYDNVNWYGTTQLHRIDARTVFPCFDEPEFKAKFRMHISRPNQYNSVFNTRLVHTTMDGINRSIDHFEETPLMSTYLVAFVISDFESFGNEDLKIIMHSKFNNKTNLAYEVGLKALEAYDNYTQLPYKSMGNTIMQKVGSNHFPHSGMENWGLVVYKDSALAHEPGFTDGWSNKQYTVGLIMHETAHMWFGDSVTHKWWSYFWLNEAFPNYYQYFLAHEFYPEYELDKQFLIKELYPIFDVDASNNTQPMTSLEKSINTPQEIGSKFSNIAYSKGAAILRMFSNLMGKDNFDKAIKNYLKENHLKTAVPEDLFKHLKNHWPSNQIVNLDIFFKDWTEQEGYPLVTASISPSGCYSIKQQRFLLDPNDGSNATLKYTIPITFNNDKMDNFNNLVPKFYLTKDQDEILFGNASDHKWFIVNTQQSNYYRVFYDTELLKQIKSVLKETKHAGIHVNNRAGIIDDLFAYSRNGLRGYDEVLDFLEYLATEVEYLPWQAAFKGLDTLYYRFTLAQHDKFKDFLFEILDKVYKKLGFKNPKDTVLDVYNRNKVISWLCKYHHDDCNTQAQKIFRLHLSVNTKPNSDFRETLYCAAVRNDNSDIYASLKKTFLNEQLASEKQKILQAMGCTRYFVKDHFEFVLSDSVTLDLKTHGLKSLYSQTPENILIVFDFIMDYPEQLAEVLQGWDSTAAIIEDIAQYLTTPEQLTRLNQFTKEKGHLFGPSANGLEKSIQIVETNLIWSSNRLGKLMNYLTLRNAEYRLTKDIIPHLYNIYLKPHLKQEDGDKQFTFDGEVNITIRAIKPNLRKITLHKDNIDILKTVLYDSNGNVVENITSGSMLYECLTNKLTVYLFMPLEVNATYIVYFKYQGQIRSDLSGVFRATYDNVNWYGITQLQRIDARTAFPCFDEPDFKAKFRMRISRQREYNSVFNTKLNKSIVEGNDRYVDYFEETPLMSTYLIAFLISDFQSNGNADFKLIMHSKFNNKTNFTYEVGLRILEAYDNYTQIPYKTLGNSIMQKTGSPSFPHNGMENWGLVIYKDSVLAHEPGYTDGWSDKQYTITILAHETSHMWFGNSVTFKWWSYFWLNEAFARYYQYFLSHEIYPEYELDKQFVVNQVQLIFGTDASNNTQPLSSPEQSINTPAELGYKFSGITYAKGASIVRMFANLMGKRNFDQAVREYLKENHLRNVVPEDLFKYLKKHWPKEHNVDLDEFFKDWTEQVGYPVVTVSYSSNGRFSLKQKRFLLDPNDGSDASIRYTIPITFNDDMKRNYSDFTPKFYFNKTLEEVQFKNTAHHDWILVNTQQSNYYRVFYELDLLKHIRIAFEQPNHSAIHVSNRASVVDDLFTFGQAGLKGYDEIFEFMEYLATETEYTPWYAAFKGINTLYVRMTLEQHGHFGPFLYELLDKVYNKLSFQNSNDSVLDVYNRNKVISWLCKYHHEDCNTHAKHIFLSYLSKSTKPTPDFRETLYCAACRNDKSDIYGYLKEMFKHEELLSEKEKIVRAMGCTRYNVNSHYKFILSNKVPQDLKTIALTSLYMQTPENIMTVFQLMIENVEEISEALQSWFTTADVISGISEYLTTQEQLNMFQQFTHEKGHLFGTSVNILENSIKTIERNLEWADLHVSKLFQYLSQRNGAATTSIALLPVSVLLVTFKMFM